MVNGKPYIRFKINNEPTEQVLDYNHTWATTIESTKGPINTPTLITSATQAKNIFDVNMDPYFAQGASSLIIVRVAAKSINNEPRKGVFNFCTEKPIKFAIAQQAVLEKIVNNTRYEHELFYVKLLDSNNNITYKPVIRYRDSNGNIVPDYFADSWFDDGRAITQKDKEEDGDRIARARTGNDAVDTTASDYDPASYSNLVVANKYSINQVNPLLVPKMYNIPAGSSLIELKSLYEGDYGITVSCAESYTIDEEGYYNIHINEPQFGTISIRDTYDLSKIVARINNANFNVTASLTDDGAILNAAMRAQTAPIDLDNIIIDGTTTQFITSSVEKDSFITLAEGNENTPYLTNVLAPTQTPIPYVANFMYYGSQPLINGSNGEWDSVNNRIPTEYQAEAHRNGLKTLQKIRLSGVFCMYGEELIQREYLYHGINPNEPEKGMNNNETCKWRTILLGANANDRTDTASLVQKAVNIDNQYVLLLGHGLIDTGMTGYAYTLSERDRMLELGMSDPNYLLPYECTQYIAGLRAKLEYYESIFGGQGRKRIRSIGDLKIAPLLFAEEEYEWNPNQYITLNEGGVLTFTEEYGNITLTDGVTTVQAGEEEDEEGVVNILKYAENAIYDVCLPYIGRNINADLENSINMAVESVLASMRDDEQSLVDTDEYSAYSVNISLGSRSNQLLGKIYIYLTITPVHALRQIEVEMTVQ